MRSAGLGVLRSMDGPSVLSTNWRTPALYTAGLLFHRPCSSAERFPVRRIRLCNHAENKNSK